MLNIEVGQMYEILNTKFIVVQKEKYYILVNMETKERWEDRIYYGDELLKELYSWKFLYVGNYDGDIEDYE